MTPRDTLRETSKTQQKKTNTLTFTKFILEHLSQHIFSEQKRTRVVSFLDLPRYVPSYLYSSDYLLPSLNAPSVHILTINQLICKQNQTRSFPGDSCLCSYSTLTLISTWHPLCRRNEASHRIGWHVKTTWMLLLPLAANRVGCLPFRILREAEEVFFRRSLSVYDVDTGQVIELLILFMYFNSPFSFFRPQSTIAIM